MICDGRRHERKKKISMHRYIPKKRKKKQENYKDRKHTNEKQKRKIANE